MEVPKCWKIVEFPKISIKKKKCTPPDKSLLRLSNKNFLYGDIQKYTDITDSKVLGECSWVYSGV